MKPGICCILALWLQTCGASAEPTPPVPEFGAVREIIIPETWLYDIDASRLCAGSVKTLQEQFRGNLGTLSIADQSFDGQSRNADLQNNRYSNDKGALEPIGAAKLFVIRIPFEDVALQDLKDAVPVPHIRLDHSARALDASMAQYFNLTRPEQMEGYYNFIRVGMVIGVRTPNGFAVLEFLGTLDENEEDDTPRYHMRFRQKYVTQ